MSDENFYPEQELMELILKYRDAVNNEEYLPVTQREQDREKLNAMYKKLQTIKQKILDSRCYRELGLLQKQLSNRFLADDTSPDQRLTMLAYLVRSMCHPLMVVSGRNTVVADWQESNEKEAGIEIIEMEQRPPIYKSKAVTPEELEEIRRQLHEMSKRYSLKELRSELSLKQAEILSQMAAGGEIEITIRGKARLNGTVTSVVLKESVAHD